MVKAYCLEEGGNGQTARIVFPPKRQAYQHEQGSSGEGEREKLGLALQVMNATDPL